MDLDNNSLKIINEIYKKDFELFGYQKKYIKITPLIYITCN